MGVPTRMSAWPEYRCSRAAKAASRSMKGVTCSFTPRARSRCCSALGSAKCSVAPRSVCAAGRGLSVGRARTGEAPSSSFFQYAICSSSFSPWNQSRCQHAKSAYCTGSSASGDGRFCRERRVELLYLVLDQPHAPFVNGDVVNDQEHLVLMPRMMNHGRPKKRGLVTGRMSSALAHARAGSIRAPAPAPARTLKSSSGSGRSVAGETVCISCPSMSETDVRRIS